MSGAISNADASHLSVPLRTVTSMCQTDTLQGARGEGGCVITNTRSNSLTDREATTVFQTKIHALPRAAMNVEDPLHPEDQTHQVTGAYVSAVIVMLVTIMQITDPAPDPHITDLQRAAVAVCLLSVILSFLHSKHRHAGRSLRIVHYLHLVAYAILLVTIAPPSSHLTLFPFLVIILAVLPLLLGPRVPVPLMITVASLFPLALVLLTLSPLLLLLSSPPFPPHPLLSRVAL